MIRICLTLALLASPAFAADPQPQTAIAMQGAASLPETFDHFPYVNANAPHGGTLRLGASGTFTSLNEWIIKGDPAEGLDLVYDRLMARSADEPFTLYALVADSVTLPDSRDWIEFHLNKAARFHDGTAITPADVLFTFETLKKYGLPVTRQVYARVAKAEQTGASSVRFTLQPDHDRETPLILALMPVLPAHAFTEKEFNRTTMVPPLGSGPYEVAAVDPGRSLTYRRVSDYWGRDLPVNRGRYNFDTVRYDYYRDEGTMLEGFRAGALDMRRETDAARWATGYDFPAVGQGKVRLERLANGRPAPMRALVFNTRRPLFSDRRVREALTDAFDFETANRLLFHDGYKRLNSYFAPSELAARGIAAGKERDLLEAHRTDVPGEVFGPAWQAPETDGSGPAGARDNMRRADALLNAAGWVVQNEKRVDAKTGAPFRFEILLADPGEERLMLFYARALSALGIEAHVRAVDTAQYTARTENFDYDTIVNRWAMSLSPGNEQLIYFGSVAADTPGSRNYAGVKNSAIDAIAAGLGDTRTRGDLVAGARALDRILTWSSYAIPLYYIEGDLIASWTTIAHPSVMPLYGTTPDTWWSIKPDNRANQ